MRTRPEPPAADPVAFALGFLAALPAAVAIAGLIVWAATKLLLWAGVMG